MSLSILIETMRREGYEFQVSPARVLYQEIDGVKCEPIERLVVDVPGDCVGAVIEKLGSRKADMVEMTPVGNRMKIEFLIPARGLFGYRSDFLTDTKGEGIMASVFDSYAPYKGDISRRGTGSMISFDTGESVTYGLYNAQERGTLFIGPGVPVYGGMVIGVSPVSYTHLLAGLVHRLHFDLQRLSEAVRDGGGSGRFLVARFKMCIRDSPYAVAQIIADYFGTGEVREWYQYGGKPYHFKIGRAHV